MVEKSGLADEGYLEDMITRVGGRLDGPTLDSFPREEKWDGLVRDFRDLAVALGDAVDRLQYSGETLGQLFDVFDDLRSELRNEFYESLDSGEEA
jgi:hypothetical protein